MAAEPDNFWIVLFINEIEEFLDSPYRMIMTNPWKSWSVRRKDKMAFHDQLDGIEINLIFAEKNYLSK
jgi:hypothetical protein